MHIEAQQAGEKDPFLIQLMVASLAIILIAAIAVAIYPLAMIITITPKKITFKRPFQKTIERTYDELNFVYRASYLHIAYYPQYIIITDHFMREKDLQQINAFSNDESMIKIRYRKSVYKKLLRVLPETHTKRLIYFFGEL